MSDMSSAVVQKRTVGLWRLPEHTEGRPFRHEPRQRNRWPLERRSGPTRGRFAMLLTPLLEQLVAGIAAALILCSVLWWTPIARKLLGALAVAGILNLLVADRNVLGVPDRESFPGRLVQELIGYPYFSLGVAIV